MHQVFLDLDGSLLRRRLFRCHVNEELKDVGKKIRYISFYYSKV